ncbi:CBO0543 family protein [Clostridium psychrophilum]|uniref:CBO0543 family protein n=1 Tax=Clostridium psychrophilum TaxID=132926 RepID=UPI001C0CA389|nr:CBO0543 family protein [Clostridium psychrophilum]MBU3180222.1 hypothetical protein [Clostridium psychrophilum]
MNRDYVLIIIEWIVTIGLLIRFIPRNKIREAHVIFLFKGLLTWILSLTVSEFKLNEYPVRFFPYANKTSFTFEFFVYPAICAIFNINFPEKKNSFGRFMYYFYYCTTMTILELITEKYTNILKYIHWTWYITWITLFITFFISRTYYKWFFRLKNNDK